MSRILKLLLLATLWVLGVWGSLKIHTLDMNLGHSICGPWGCGPPVEALIGFHVFWLALLWPAVVGIGIYFTPVIRRKVGLTIVVFSLLAILFLAGRETYGLWSRTESAKYLIQKFFFTIATNVDIPMLQILLSGCGLVWFGKRVIARKANVIGLGPIGSGTVACLDSPK